MIKIRLGRRFREGVHSRFQQYPMFLLTAALSPPSPTRRTRNASHLRIYILATPSVTRDDYRFWEPIYL